MKILLAGDFSPTKSTNELFKIKDIKTLFGDTLSLFEGNDINFVNPWSEWYPHWPLEIVIRYDTETGDVERIPVNINFDITGIELSKGETLQTTLTKSKPKF